MSGLRSRAAEFGLTEAEWDEAERREGRELNALEAAIVGAMWSEHCSYKNSRPLMRAFPTSGPQVLQGPGENAGVVDIGDGYAVAFKVESHNRPSAVEPVQGAATGVGGILRDIFAMGARPFAVLNSLRLGDASLERTRYLLDGIVTGVSGYGGAVGVPTVGGEITFHESFNMNPLVNVMALGLLRHEDLARGTMGEAGNRVLYVGSRTGRDGTGGAVFSSAELSSDSPVERPAVQAGDPYLEHLLMEATLAAIEAGLVAGVQDMGAAGLLSSTSEMAHRAGLGVDIQLDRVPVREDGLEPWELVLSESQERMILVPVSGREQELAELLGHFGLDVAEIGVVASHGRYRLHWHGELVCDLDVSLLNEAPLQTREGVESQEIRALREQDLSGLPQVNDFGGVLLQLLSRPTIASKRAVFERFDQQVMTNTVVLPGEADAAVMRIRGTELGVAAVIDCNPRYVQLDPFEGAAGAVAEAARNLACVGATPLALTDNLNFGDPYRPEVYWQLEQAIAGISAAASALDTPVTGGNVSLYNQYQSEGATVAIQPTPTIGMVGVLPDVARRATFAFPDEDGGVYLLGKFGPTLGGSEYLAAVHGLEAGAPPAVDLKLEARTIEAILQLIRAGHTSTAHDLSDGGLAVALAELALSNGRGLTISLESAGVRADQVLFGEAHGLIVTVILDANRAEAEELLDRLGVWWQRIGTTGGTSLNISVDTEPLLDVQVTELTAAYEGTLPRVLDRTGLRHA